MAIRSKPTAKQFIMTSKFCWLPYHLSLLLWFVSTIAYAETPYRISYIYDGDTLQLSRGAEKIKLRLQAIDAPERHQSYGQKARRALMQLCMQQDTKIEVHISGRDKYQRSLGSLRCNGIDASMHLLQNGYAWPYQKHNAAPEIILAAEQARINRQGLWQQDNPTPPWVWRRLNPSPQ